MWEFIAYLAFSLAAMLALIFALQCLQKRHADPPPPEPAVDLEASPLSDAAATVLLSMFQDFYRQEITAEEDVHRTLPFFATALGLIITALNFVGSQFPDWTKVLRSCAADHRTFDWGVALCAWPIELAGVLLLVSALAAVGVLVLLVMATRRRGYERVGPEAAYVERAQAFQAYHATVTPEHRRGAAVGSDLRNQLIKDFALALPANRNLTLRRYAFRAQAVAWLLWSLFSALAATIIVICANKFDPLG